ncbi:glutathione S-transferase [Nitrincola alkalilacustris]|uniref:glutathione S-transferase n=1 Tax=Nitrincola alkalilacustris TaxID=1571224 RepID=UPI00124C03E2|nr:glutathione S-transferase [Nitrincola alkalilacustris]
MSLSLENCINSHCPWSGNPVSAEALALYRGVTVGFCNPGCRDKFIKATSLFDELLNSLETTRRGKE